MITPANLQFVRAAFELTLGVITHRNAGDHRLIEDALACRKALEPSTIREMCGAVRGKLDAEILNDALIETGIAASEIVLGIGMTPEEITAWEADIDINGTLVDEGLAWAFIRFSDDYAGREATARAAGVGIWQGEAEPAWEYRENRWERAAEASPRPGCPVKGNINRQGERIYHTPWSPWYSRTKISEADGERWFCDEAEAQTAGWRAPYWR